MTALSIPDTNLQNIMQKVCGMRINTSHKYTTKEKKQPLIPSTWVQLAE